MTPFTWVVIFGLIAVNALYVAAEFAAVGARRSRIRQLTQEGNALAARLLPVLEDTRKLDRYIAACQIGITLSSLVLGAYGQATLAVWLSPLFAHWADMQQAAAQSTSALVVLVGLTMLQVLLGELVPKSLALQYPVQSALYTVSPMRWSLRLFSWFIILLNGSGWALLKLLRIPAVRPRHIHSPHEIEMLLAESRDGGLLEADEHQRLRRALQLAARPVHHLMVSRRYVSALDVATPADRIVSKVATDPYSRIPVYRDSVDHIIGVLHTKDLLLHYIERGEIPSVERLMRPVEYMPRTVAVDRALALLRRRGSHQAIVVDEYGGVEGLVSLEDVLGELLGEVRDEFKAGQQGAERLPDGRVRLPGLMRPDEAEPWLGVLWQGTADTIAGHVVEALGHVPAAGDTVEIDGVAVEVERVENYAIVSLLATPVPPHKEGSGE